MEFSKNSFNKIINFANNEEKNKHYHNLSMIENNLNINKSDVYNNWADSYNDYVNKEGYVGPRQLTEKILPFILNLISNSVIIDELNILDFGCGTGLLGLEIYNNLNKLGIKNNLNGIDISKEMIKYAKKTEAYSNIFCYDLISDSSIPKHNISESVESAKSTESTESAESAEPAESAESEMNAYIHDHIYKEAFDIVVSCGVFLEGHVSLDRIHDVLLPLVKKNGLLAFTVRASFLSEFPEFFSKLNKNKNVAFFKNYSINYLNGIPACAIIIKVL